MRYLVLAVALFAMSASGFDKRASVFLDTGTKWVAVLGQGSDDTLLVDLYDGNQGVVSNAASYTWVWRHGPLAEGTLSTVTGSVVNASQIRFSFSPSNLVTAVKSGYGVITAYTNGLRKSFAKGVVTVTPSPEFDLPSSSTDPLPPFYANERAGLLALSNNVVALSNSVRVIQNSTSNWNLAFSWGNWATRMATLESRSNFWNTAYSWGDWRTSLSNEVSARVSADAALMASNTAARLAITAEALARYVAFTNEAALRASGDVKGTNYTDYVFSQVPAQTQQLYVAQSGTSEVSRTAERYSGSSIVITNMIDAGAGRYDVLSMTATTIEISNYDAGVLTEKSRATKNLLKFQDAAGDGIEYGSYFLKYTDFDVGEITLGFPSESGTIETQERVNGLLGGYVTTNDARVVNALTNTPTLQQVVTAGGSVTSGVVTIDAANARTNTYGGLLGIGPNRWQANGGVASGDASWANFEGIASGIASWANLYGVASGVGSWACNYGIASGGGSWASGGATASGYGSWAMGATAVASNNYSFAWNDQFSHGDGTFNIGAPSLLWLQNTNLQTLLDGKLGTNATAVNSTLLDGYTINEIMAVGATYYFTTNIVSYGVVSGRSALLTPPLVAQTLTYAGTVTNGQVFGQYLIPSNEVPAIIQRGVYTFNFFGGHSSNPGKNPTIRGKLSMIHSGTGVTAYEYASVANVVIPYGEEPFHITVNVTNDIAKDALAVLLTTYMLDNDGYTGDFTSDFGPPTYAGFTFPKVNGLYVLKSEFDATTLGATNSTINGKAATFDTATRTLAHTVTAASIGAVSNSAAGIAAAGGVTTNSIPGPGCTYLGTSQAVTITGATTSYRAEPSGVYTVSVAQAASRYTYALEVISTNPCTLAAGLNLQGSWTITGTNILCVVPCTGTLWRVYGRGI